MASQPWMHYGDVSREEAEARLMDSAHHAVVDGTFLVRERARYPSDFVLAVVYRGKPTHHLVTKENGATFFTVNKRDYGQSTTLEELVHNLTKPGQPGWPVPLKNGVPAPSSNGKNNMTSFSIDTSSNTNNTNSSSSSGAHYSSEDHGTGGSSNSASVLGPPPQAQVRAAPDPLPVANEEAPSAPTRNAAVEEPVVAAAPRAPSPALSTIPAHDPMLVAYAPPQPAPSGEPISHSSASAYNSMPERDSDSHPHTTNSAAATSTLSSILGTSGSSSGLSPSEARANDSPSPPPIPTRASGGSATDYHQSARGPPAVAIPPLSSDDTVDPSAVTVTLNTDSGDGGMPNFAPVTAPPLSSRGSSMRAALPLPPSTSDELNVVAETSLSDDAVTAAQSHTISTSAKMVSSGSSYRSAQPASGHGQHVSGGSRGLPTSGGGGGATSPASSHYNSVTASALAVDYSQGGSDNGHDSSASSYGAQQHYQQAHGAAPPSFARPVSSVRSSMDSSSASVRNISFPPPPSQDAHAAASAHHHSVASGMRASYGDSSTDAPSMRLASSPATYGAESNTDPATARRLPQGRPGAPGAASLNNPAGGVPMLSLEAQGGMFRAPAASTTDSSGAGESTELNKTLARAVIKLGTRVANLENKMGEAIQAILALQKLCEQLKERVR